MYFKLFIKRERKIRYFSQTNFKYPLIIIIIVLIKNSVFMNENFQ
jgi:hypothetical protein